MIVPNQALHATLYSAPERDRSGPGEVVRESKTHPEKSRLFEIEVNGGEE